MYRSFDEISASIIKKEQKPYLAVAHSDDEASVSAAIYVYRENIAVPLFIGNKYKIEELILKYGYNKGDFFIENSDDPALSCKKAVALVREGNAHIIMKGHADSSVFLRAVTDKETGLGKNKLMSHLAVFEVPGFPRLISVVDGGMVPYPTLNEKKLIIENTAECLINMGCSLPKAAVVTCVEKVNPKMPETLDAAALKEMNQRGEIKNCIVEGPISFDCAVDEEIARAKGFSSPVAGKADILLLPDIHSANICGKALITMAKAKMAGFVAGGICPIILSSRAASAEEKFYSVVLGAAAFKGTE